MLKLTIDPDSGFAVKELFFTANPSMKNVYAIFAKYPDDRTLIIRDFTPDAYTTFTLLSSGEHLIWKKTGKDVLVTLPSLQYTDLKMPWAWAMRIHQE
jgi:alpha-L-fucosidase